MNTLVEPFSQFDDIRSGTDVPAPDLLGALSAARSVEREQLVNFITTDLGKMLEVFDDEDRQQFMRELHDALRGPMDRLEMMLDGWATTADAIRNSENRDILLGPADTSDFVQVHRPE